MIEASAAVQTRVAVNTRGGANQNGKKGRADQSAGAGESSGLDWSSGASKRSEAGGSGAGQKRRNRREPQLSRGVGTDNERLARRALSNHAQTWLAVAVQTAPACTELYRDQGLTQISTTPRAHEARTCVRA